MTVPLPENITYGKVIGRFLKATIDGSDGSDNPDGVAAQGTVVFTPTPAYVLDATATPPTTVVPVTVTCGLDSDGDLVSPSGEKGVWLIATDDADLNPSGWTYTVTVVLRGVAARAFSITVPAGSEQDLSLISPVAASEGDAIVVGPEGPSAYEVAVNEGFVGTEAEWLESLVATVDAHEAAASGAHAASAISYAGSTNLAATTVEAALDELDTEKATAAQGTKADAAIPAPAGPTDGNLLAYNSTLAAWVPVAPVGQSELAAAVNVTGTPTTVSATSGPGVLVAIPGSSISIPASSRPVTLFYEAAFAQTTVGTGMGLVSLYETTGAATQMDYVAGTLPNSTATGLREVSLSRSYRLGATVATRTFELRAWVYQVSGSPAGSILNSALRQTSLRAVAG